MTNKDKITLELIEEVAKKKKEISKLEKPSYKTNMSFSYPGGSPINLQVESDINNLLNIAGFLLSIETYNGVAATNLEVSDRPVPSWNGFPIRDWAEDINTRISKCQIGAKKKKLEALENRLNAIISPELRAQMELEAIQKELGK